jgi:hypothetical protein
MYGLVMYWQGCVHQSLTVLCMLFELSQCVFAKGALHGLC